MTNNRSLIVNIPEVRLENFTLIVVDLYRQWVLHNFKKLSHDFRNKDEVISGHWALVSGSVKDSNGESILVYFDKLMDPYLRLHTTDYLNYGGFGAFLAREISKSLLSMEVGELPAEQKTTWDALLSTRNASQCLLNFFAENFDIDSEKNRHDAMRVIFLDRMSLEIAYESAKSMVPSNP
ncbi:uncharacterized protein LOC129226123 [Uloborus diversus]|uniref:uncharacterized protein LOC129226123 n=1 Tax=Uloborus diversus TaxID=327109 RepID=UPI0024097945|nr:uncharacterized protein LOC129226123 [Uloborus diversus]